MNGVSNSGSHASEQSRIELTDVERTFRKLMLDVADHIDTSPSPTGGDSQVTLPPELAEEKLVLRFTGGWVRDKLLGVESHDIDVSINKMTGFQFGLRMKEYLEQPGNLEKYGLEGVAKTDAQSNKAGTTDKSKLVGGLHKIEANPEKSKHLETVTTRIFGLDIDLVNLRKETYSEDSRNPQMEFGTPEEDALRRDATVNAMFYNIHTGQVEDFTQMGHNDMQSKIIRTPLEPYQTFKDDPLRVLRLIRFASRLGYTIEPSAANCMENEEIKDALRAKISRERVGVELEKMLRGPDPYMAVDTIRRLGLYRTIFSDPVADPKKAYLPEEDNFQEVVDGLPQILRDCDLPTLARDKEEKYLAWVLACLVPYRFAPEPEPPEPNRKSPPLIPTLVAREGIKATNKICEVVTASVRNREHIQDLVRKLQSRTENPQKAIPGEDPSARDVLGMAIRRWGASWRSQVTFAILSSIADEPSTFDTIVAEYKTFIAKLSELDVLEAYALKPLIDGKTLAKALQTAPGPWMKEALDVVMAWQLRRPGQVSAEEAIEEVRNSKIHGELKTDLIAHLLKLTIRPLFSKSRHPAVTAQGREVTTRTLPKKIEFDENEAALKPWKERDGYALELLAWITQNLSERLVKEYWHLLAPPILTITDDTDPKIKAKGCRLIKGLLERTPPSLLAKTGLGQVFEDALMPCLSYLPTLTPENESLTIISEVHPALIVLSRTAFAPLKGKANTSKLTTNTSTNVQQKRNKFLDTIVRKGILSPYSNCPEHAKIVTLLLEKLSILLNELGIESVKHLKSTLPMLVEVLSNPFSSAHPPLLPAAASALQAIILNGWPRMYVNRGEVLKGLMICWLETLDNEDIEVKQARSNLKETVAMLRSACRRDGDIDGDLAELVRADERLQGLFEVSLSDQ